MTSPRRPGCCSGRSCRSTATPTCSPCTSTPRRPGSTPTATRSAAAGRPRTSTTPPSGSRPPPGPASTPTRSSPGTALRVPQGEQLSFGTYFNAFPATYWRRWTVVDAVTLTVQLRGAGATVTVYRSMANGRSQRVDLATDGAEGSATFTFDLSLAPFVDGGWYWYDVVAGDEDVVVESAEWTAEVPEDRAEHGTADIAITTMNRPDFCAKLLGQIGRRRRAAALPRRGPGHGAGHPAGHRARSSSPPPRRRSATSCGSSSRATSAAPAATPAASSRRCARAPRRT